MCIMCTIYAKIKHLLIFYEFSPKTTKLREQSLKEAVALHQFQTDANDMEAWIMETLRQLSSQELGHDEFSTQTLARKQREIDEEIQSHRPLINTLHEQAQALPQAYVSHPQVCVLYFIFPKQHTLPSISMFVCCLLQVDGRLPAIEQSYKELESLSATRRQALDGALSLYQMFSEADACLLWVEEKEQWLDGMEIPTKLEDLEVVQQRLVRGRGKNLN